MLPASDSEEDDEGYRRGDRGRGAVGSGGPGGNLPGTGALGGAGSSRSQGLDKKKRPVIRCKHVTFAPTGQGWAASTTEGSSWCSRAITAPRSIPRTWARTSPSAARRAAARRREARVAHGAATAGGADDDETLVAETLESIAGRGGFRALEDFPASLFARAAPRRRSRSERVTKLPHAHLMLGVDLAKHLVAHGP